MKKLTALHLVEEDLLCGAAQAALLALAEGLQKNTALQLLELGPKRSAVAATTYGDSKPTEDAVGAPEKEPDSSDEEQADGQKNVLESEEDAIDASPDKEHIDGEQKEEEGLGGG